MHDGEQGLLITSILSSKNFQFESVANGEYYVLCVCVWGGGGGVGGGGGRAGKRERERGEGSNFLYMA